MFFEFFLSMLDVPFVDGEEELAHYKEQIQCFILDRLNNVYGIDTSEEALRKAIDAQNEINAIITEIGQMRKLDNPPITGYEFHVIQLVSQVCPIAEIKPYLQETLKEIKKRKPDPKPWYRTRIVVAGSEIDDPAFTKLIEECGAFVVADRYCWGSLPGREPITIEKGETALDAIARYYLMSSECPRFMNSDRSERRREYVRQLCREYNAAGVLYEQMKFCEFWSYERVLANHVFNEEFEIPCLGIEKEYTMSGAGQTRTRVQAFVESLEIKEIQKEGK